MPKSEFRHGPFELSLLSGHIPRRNRTECFRDLRERRAEAGGPVSGVRTGAFWNAERPPVPAMQYDSSAKSAEVCTCQDPGDVRWTYNHRATTTHILDRVENSLKTCSF